MRGDWHWGQLGTGDLLGVCDVEDGRRTERMDKEKAPGGEHAGLGLGDGDGCGSTETA